MNQKINHWNKPTQFKKIKQKKTFLMSFKSFFTIVHNASPLSYAIQREEEARVDGTKNAF